MAEDKGKNNSKDGEEQAVATPAAGKNKKIILIAAGVLIVLMAIGIPLAIFMSKPEKVETKSAEKVEVDIKKNDLHKLSQDAEEELEEGEEILGAIAPLDTFVVNLKGGRFVRLQMQLEFVERDVPQRLSQRAAIVRDALITLLTTKSADDMLEREGKEKLRKEVRNVVNEVLKKELVKKVYFTQFVVQ